MEVYQQIRGEFGFRDDEAYIRSLIRRGLVLTWDVQRFPMTRRELRYLKLRDRLDLGPRADGYLRRRPDIDGGTSIEDAWPRDPYLLVRLKHDRARHARQLRRLARYPSLLRTKKVPLSERDLARIQDRIDFRAARRDGFDVTGTAPDIDRSVVEIELITSRTDHLAYFRKRYGTHVATRVVATERYSPACREINEYEVDGARIDVGWESGGGVKLDHLEVAEADDRVTIGVVVQSYNGGQTLESRTTHNTVELSRPLGDRTLIDATTGKPARKDQL